jgi:hypothetical protein
MTAVIDTAAKNLNLILGPASIHARNVNRITMHSKNYKYPANTGVDNNLRTYSQVSRFKVCPSSGRVHSWLSLL